MSSDWVFIYNRQEKHALFQHNKYIWIFTFCWKTWGLKVRLLSSNLRIWCLHEFLLIRLQYRWRSVLHSKFMCVFKCEKDRQGGGRDGHQREEIVGSASSFIAALMSPGTHRLETAVLFSGRQIYTATDTQKHMYIQSGMHTHTPI